MAPGRCAGGVLYRPLEMGVVGRGLNAKQLTAFFCTISPVYYVHGNLKRPPSSPCGWDARSVTSRKAADGPLNWYACTASTGCGCGWELT